MNRIFGSAVAVAMAAGLASAATGPANAQSEYPVETVTMVVPYAAGGAGDTVGRIVADELGKRLGVNFVVENVGGASGTIGAERVARSPNDGSTLLLAGNAIYTTAPHLAAVGYEPFEDFTAIANVSHAVRILVASKSLPVSNFEEFVEYAKAHPGELNYGSVGVGSTGHVSTIDMVQTVGIEAQHVPYSGSSQVIQAVLSGDIQFMMDAAAKTQALQDTVTPLAVPGDQPLPEFPELPTLVSLGYDSISGTGMQMVMGPAGMPAEVVAMLEDALREASEDPAFAETLTRAGVTPRFIPGDELYALLEADYNKYDSVLTELGLAQ